MSIKTAIDAANESAQKCFGRDITILVARSPAFGNDDTCIIVRGKRHDEAAIGFARFKGAKLTTESGRSMDGREYTYSLIVIPAEASRHD